MSYEQLEPGLYPFTIEDANIKYVSKAGNTSLRLVLKIQHNGKNYTAWDYLTNKKGPDGKPFIFIIKKKEDLLRTIGQEFLIDKLNLVSDEHLIGRSGKCIVKVETHPDYGTQIKVVKYYNSVIEEPKQASLPTMENPSFLDEDIPF